MFGSNTNIKFVDMYSWHKNTDYMKESRQDLQFLCQDFRKYLLSTVVKYWQKCQMFWWSDISDKSILIADHSINVGTTILIKQIQLFENLMRHIITYGVINTFLVTYQHNSLHQIHILSYTHIHKNHWCCCMNNWLRHYMGTPINIHRCL